MADKIINNPSITPNDFGYDESNAISSILGKPLAGSGGTTIVESDFVWLPSVNDSGVISWQRATSATEPLTANIKGPQGDSGKDGTNGTNGTNGVDGISPTFKITSALSSTIVEISGAQGKETFTINNGKDGTNGINGTNGFSPLFTINDLDTSTYPQGGKQVSIQYGDSGSLTTSFDILNGTNSQAASVNLHGIDGVKTDYNSETSAYDIGLSGHCYPEALSAYSAEYSDYTRNAIFSNNATSSMDEIKDFIDVDNKTLHDTSATLFNFSANWNNVSAKSYTTITPDQVITTENNGTSATVSAVQYVHNDTFLTAPQQIFVCKNEEDLTGHLSISQNKGTLFFVCSAI